MDTWLYVLLAFILTSMVVTLIAILVSPQMRAQIRLPGRAEFLIEVQKGWQRKPQAHRPARQADDTGRRQFQKWLAIKGRPEWRFPLDGRKMVYIGRRQDNDLVLRDQAADTRQAVIYWEGDRYKINNLSSKTPTKVNGRPITKQNLGNGNTIQMGRTKLIFRDRASS